MAFDDQSAEQVRHRLEQQLNEQRWDQRDEQHPFGAPELKLGNPDFFERVTGDQAGGYEFDADAINDIIKECRQLRADLLRDARDYRDIQATTPPANDAEASGMFVDKVRQFGLNQEHRNQAWIDYLDAFIDNMVDARNQYQERERGSAGQFRDLNSEH